MLKIFFFFFQTQSQYVLAGQANQTNTRLTTNGTTLHHLGNKPRTHLTINPYSTQLVNNINMMMGSSGSKQSTISNESGSSSTMSPQLLSLTQTLKRQQPDDVVYRAVSPNGHIYWEIDPNTANHLLHQQQSEPLTDLDFRFNNSSNSSGSSENHPLISQNTPHQEVFPMRPSSSANDFNNSFVRTGAGRYNRRPVKNDSHVPEQLQTQVQIRDIKPIQVSVKSSEYIEAKIRTLRKNNNINLNNNVHS